MNNPGNFPSFLTSHFKAPFDARTAPVAGLAGKNLVLAVDEYKVAIKREHLTDEMSRALSLAPIDLGPWQFQELKDKLVYIGEFQQSSLWALPYEESLTQKISAAKELSFATIREIGSLLSEQELTFALVAVGMVAWIRDYQYCAKCAKVLRSEKFGWVRSCVNNHLHFPRTDPAVIVALVDSQNRLLLAQNIRSAKATLSVLAGFVEPGESCESAVIREIYEEVGLVVGDVKYLSSQPWPYPRSLMIAFSAKVSESDPDNLKLQKEEISYAKWFSKEEFDAALLAGSLQIPDQSSVSHSLIKHWYQNY